MTLSVSRTTLLTDAALLAGACLIPAASHLLAFPLYHLDPMRWLLLGALFVGARHNSIKRNGLIMAVLLPLISSLIVGMPSITKALLMMAELTANVAFFCWFGKKANSTLATFGSFLASVMAAKVVYYGVKAVMIAGGVMMGSLISTAVTTQIAVAVVLSGVVALVLNKR